MLLTPKYIIDNLTRGSKYALQIKCDYCLEKFSRSFAQYNEIKNNSRINKDYCRKCVKIKNIEEFLISINSTQINEIINYLLKNKVYKIQGVYCLRNKINNKAYIGSSNDIIKRWKNHIIEINNKNHHCEEFNNIKPNDIEFIVLNFNDLKIDLIELEYKYIQLFKSYNPNMVYNVMNRKKQKSLPSKNIKFSKETILKRSKLSIDDVKQIKNALVNGANMNSLAKQFNVNYATIQSIKSCQIWSDVLPELNDLLKQIKYSKGKKGSKNNSSKLTEEQVKEIKFLINKGESLTNIAKKFGVSRTLIGHIKRGKLWRHVS